MIFKLLVSILFASVARGNYGLSQSGFDFQLVSLKNGRFALSWLEEKKPPLLQFFEWDGRPLNAAPIKLEGNLERTRESALRTTPEGTSCIAAWATEGKVYMHEVSLEGSSKFISFSMPDLVTFDFQVLPNGRTLIVWSTGDRILSKLGEDATRLVAFEKSGEIDFVRVFIDTSSASGLAFDIAYDTVERSRRSMVVINHPSKKKRTWKLNMMWWGGRTELSILTSTRDQLQLMLMARQEPMLVARPVERSLFSASVAELPNGSVAALVWTSRTGVYAADISFPDSPFLIQKTQVKGVAQAAFAPSGSLAVIWEGIDGAWFRVLGPRVHEPREELVCACALKSGFSALIVLRDNYVWVVRANASGILEDRSEKLRDDQVSKFSCSAAGLEDGGFIVVWSGGYKVEAFIQGRRYYADGSLAPVTMPVFVDIYPPGPLVAPLRNGGFVVAWDGNGEGDVDGILGLIYSSQGTLIDGEPPRPLRFNAFTRGRRLLLDIVPAPSGGFFVSWKRKNSQKPTIDQSVVTQRMFSSTGVPSFYHFSFLTSHREIRVLQSCTVTLLDGGWVTFSWSGAQARKYRDPKGPEITVTRVSHNRSYTTQVLQWDPISEPPLEWGRGARVCIGTSADGFWVSVPGEVLQVSATNHSEVVGRFPTNESAVATLLLLGTEYFALWGALEWSGGSLSSRPIGRHSQSFSLIRQPSSPSPGYSPSPEYSPSPGYSPSSEYSQSAEYSNSKRVAYTAAGSVALFAAVAGFAAVIYFWRKSRKEATKPSLSAPVQAL